jgi:hypothetical protein
MSVHVGVGVHGGSEWWIVWPPCVVPHSCGVSSSCCPRLGCIVPCDEQQQPASVVACLPVTGWLHRHVTLPCVTFGVQMSGYVHVLGDRRDSLAVQYWQCHC